MASSFSSPRSLEAEGGRTNFRLASLVRGLLGTQMHLRTGKVRTMKDASYVTSLFCVWDARVDQVNFVSHLVRFSKCTAVGNLLQSTFSNCNWHLKVVYTLLKAWAMGKLGNVYKRGNITYHNSCCSWKGMGTFPVTHAYLGITAVTD